MEIPPEIITNILHRLPVKSLARFRSVSKNWLAQLTHPDFIKTHRTTHSHTHLICDTNDGSLYTLPLNQQPAEHQKPTKLTLQLPHNKEVFILHGSCNGLVLGYANDFLRNHIHSLVVFNPTTREMVQLPDSGYELINSLLDIDIMYGFGYDSVTDDYKVVTISYFHYNYLVAPDSMSVHVYSLRSNTWRRVKDSPYDHSHGKSLPGVFVNGFLHWIGNKGSAVVIVGFSVADETFIEVLLPDLGDGVDIRSKSECKLVGLGEKLGMFLGDEVWVMNEYGVRESWSKISIRGLGEAPIVEPKIFYDNGKVLLISGNLMWMDDVEEKSFCGTIDISKDIKGLKVKGSYVESLVSPKFGRTNQESRDLRRPSCLRAVTYFTWLP